MPVDKIPVVNDEGAVNGGLGGGLEIQPEETAGAVPVVAERATENRSDPEF